LGFDFSAVGSEKAWPLVKQATSCAMSRLISRNKKVLEITAENAQQKPRLLRAGRANVEVVIHNPDFPNGKSGLNALDLAPGPFFLRFDRGLSS
jgi:hypothetical protein